METLLKISAHDNAAVKQYRKLARSRKERTKTGLFVLEGFRLVSDAVKNSGGEVTGIIPQCIVDRGVSAEGISELIVTPDMKERKSMMREKADAFIALPGGWGTLEEITEVMSKVSLKHLDAPCILYNLNGYYDSLKQLLEHMIEMDLSSREKQEGIYFAENLEKIQKCLAK